MLVILSQYVNKDGSYLSLKMVVNFQFPHGRFISFPLGTSAWPHSNLSPSLIILSRFLLHCLYMCCCVYACVSVCLCVCEVAYYSYLNITGQY